MLKSNNGIIYANVLKGIKCNKRNFLNPIKANDSSMAN